MLKFLVGVVVFIVSAIVGVFGFSQIIGNIKFVVTWKRTIFNFVLWGAILLLVWYAANSWLPTYMLAFYIGYAVAFIHGLSVKPDKVSNEYTNGIQALYILYHHFLEDLAPIYDNTTNQLEVGFDGLHLIEDLKSILTHAEPLRTTLIQTKTLVLENVFGEDRERLLSSINTILPAWDLFIVILKKRIDLISEKLATEMGKEYTRQYQYDEAPIAHTVTELKSQYPKLKMEYNFLRDTCISLKIPLE